MSGQFIGTRIAAAREKVGWKKADLASEVDVSPSAVGQWESGETTPNSDNLQRLAVALDVPFEWLATGRGPSPFDAKNPQDPQLALPLGDPAMQINHIFQILARIEAKIDALASKV